MSLYEVDRDNLPSVITGFTGFTAAQLHRTQVRFAVSERPCRPARRKNPAKELSDLFFSFSWVSLGFRAHGKKS
jgi:hypothetical protein